VRISFIPACDILLIQYTFFFGAKADLAQPSRTAFFNKPNDCMSHVLDAGKRSRSSRWGSRSWTT
jgi:hypothetical protein